jgi:hypothetical protein
MPDDILSFRRQFADGSIDHSDPHRPGFRVLDSDDRSRVAANDAYEAKRQRMHYANKRKAEEEDDKTQTTETEMERRQRLARQAARATLGSDAQLTLGQGRELADRAYAERTKRLQNAWRNHQP